MFEVGEVISYQQMCAAERASLQAGMNYRLHGGDSVVLMSRRPNAPYADRVLDDGTTLIYEGHDAPRHAGAPSPKMADQPDRLPSGRLTQNGRFAAAAAQATSGERPERVRVYERLHAGVWAFNGVFELTGAWQERATGRWVFKFRLELVPSEPGNNDSVPGRDLRHDRVIPSDVKLAVWRRDGGRCVECQATDKPALRPHHPVLTRRLVAGRRERPDPLRSAQPGQAQPDRVGPTGEALRGRAICAITGV